MCLKKEEIIKVRFSWNNLLDKLKKIKNINDFKKIHIALWVIVHLKFNSLSSPFLNLVSTKSIKWYKAGLWTIQMQYLFINYIQNLNTEI